MLSFAKMRCPVNQWASRKKKNVGRKGRGSKGVRERDGGGERRREWKKHRNSSIIGCYRQCNETTVRRISLYFSLSVLQWCLSSSDCSTSSFQFARTFLCFSCLSMCFSSVSHLFTPWLTHFSPNLSHLSSASFLSLSLSPFSYFWVFPSSCLLNCLAFH